MPWPRSQDAIAGHDGAQGGVSPPQRASDQELDEASAEGAGSEPRREEPLDRPWGIEGQVPASFGEARDHPVHAGLPEPGNPKLTGNPPWSSYKGSESRAFDLPVQHALGGETAGHIAQPDMGVG